ncbi:MAG: hypothetical protein RL095_490 [Verrucomicrobiota bacterium]|jgi:predicted TIM-barrel fold metal-dependent hydrolase
MNLIDTHLHLLHPERFTYAWTAGLPALSGRGFTHEQFLARVAEAKGGANVAASFFMEVDVPAEEQEGEAAYFSGLTRTGQIAGVISSCRPESPEFPAQLERLAADPSVRGLRRVLHTQPDALLTDPLLRANLRRLEATGLSFDLCVLARQLPRALELARACPETRFVLDHLGVPSITTGELDPWRTELRALATCPNVACKISGVTGYADAARPLMPQIRPFVEHAVECFGYDRLLWGSDWPVCELTFGLPAWLDASAELFAGASPDERLRLAQGNVPKWYRI